MSIPQPWGGDQGYRPREGWGDWNPRSYWVQPPQRIPPPPPFNQWVPPAEQFAFGELPRDTSRLQPLEGRYPQPPVVPPPPPVEGVSIPQANARPDWTLRDYSANQDQFSALAIALLPPPVGSSLPQMQPWMNWTLRDYFAFQDQFSALHPPPKSLLIPAPDIIAFGELPRDMTAWQAAITVRSLALTPAAPKPPSYVPVAMFATPPRDLTPEKLVIEAMKATYLAIPIVPFGETFSSFEYELLDMTPYEILNVETFPPRSPGAQIAPSLIPYIAPPVWTLAQYQALQDQFSALEAVTRVLPAGLVPQFTREALIRDIPRATLLVQNFLLPPPPPRVVPPPPPYIEWRDWDASQYQTLQDVFSAIQSAQPIPLGFRVMAATAGFYGGRYYNPGDVFDIAFAADFSDSTLNYQSFGNETAYGWMIRVSSGTPLQSTIVMQILYPNVDPKRRFVM